MAKAGRPVKEEPSVSSQVRLSQSLKKKADKRAAEMGFGFPEYVRYLIANDTKDITL